MKTIIVVDGNHLVYQTYYSMGGLKSAREEPTGIIYGFLLKVLSLGQRFHTNRFYFCWDRGPLLRNAIFPGYKGKRHLTNETIFIKGKKIPEKDFIRSQCKKLRRIILPGIGFRMVLCKLGYEADDHIARITRVRTDKFKYVIVSSDHDLYQLLKPNVIMLGNQGVYTHKHFISEYEISPSEWSEVKAIAGCSSDNVPGIRGVGEKTVCKYLRGKTPKVKNEIIHKFQISEECERNYKLVRLPFEGTPDVTIKKDMFDLSQFAEICAKYDFDSFIDPKKLKEWEQFFSGYRSAKEMIKERL